MAGSSRAKTSSSSSPPPPTGRTLSPPPSSSWTTSRPARRSGNRSNLRAARKPAARFGSTPSLPTTRWPSAGRARAAGVKPRNDRHGAPPAHRGGNVMIRTVIAAAALALAPGMAAQTAEMTYYQLPAGAYPHDVAPAPDGTVWFSGQHQGFAGRFDPKSGQLEKIPLGPGAAPHG